MKLGALLLISAALVACTNTEFIPYSGAQQKWPTAPGAMVSAKLAVPVYYGLPPRPYRVLGEIATSQGQMWAWSDVQSEAMQEKRLKVQEEFAHAERMKKQVESRSQWDKVLHHYGVFLIRDIERRLPETEEVHSSVAGLYTTGVLTDIHTEHLAFTHGPMGVKSIKNVAGAWHFADEKDDEAIKVEIVTWLNYRDILLIRWETDEYWEYPQICCRFTSAKKFPFSRVFFAERGTGLGDRPYYRGVCLVSDVFPKRPSDS